MALPSSRATPVNTCHGLRPRRCPGYSPFRIPDCCLPLIPQRRLSSCYAELILTGRNYTFFGAQYTACTLAPSGSRLPSPGLPADFATELAATLCSGGNFAACGDHPLGNNIEFHLLMETPNDSGFTGREKKPGSVNTALFLQISACSSPLALTMSCYSVKNLSIFLPAVTPARSP